MRKPYVATEHESGGNLRIGLLLASNPEMLRTYQPFLNIWRCYALRHAGLSEIALGAYK